MAKDSIPHFGQRIGNLFRTLNQRTQDRLVFLKLDQLKSEFLFFRWRLFKKNSYQEITFNELMNSLLSRFQSIEAVVQPTIRTLRKKKPPHRRLSRGINKHHLKTGSR